MKLPLKLFTNYFAIVVLSFFSMSCGGGDDPAAGGGYEYYVKYKQDGVDKIIKDESSATYTGEVHCNLNKGESRLIEGKQRFQFSVGAFATNVPSPQLKFVVESLEQITTKGYTSGLVKNSDPMVRIEGILPVTDVQRKQEGFHAESGVTVTVTEITKDFVKGRFSATVYAYRDSSIVQLTDGEFYAPRQD